MTQLGVNKVDCRQRSYEYEKSPRGINESIVIGQSVRISTSDWSLKNLKEGFKQVYGNTVFGYLYDHKMNVASQMLSTKNYNVNEVALHLGYSTASHFINAFKNKFGTTPKKYLNNSN